MAGGADAASIPFARHRSGKDGGRWRVPFFSFARHRSGKDGGRWRVPFFSFARHRSGRYRRGLLILLLAAPAAAQRIDVNQARLELAREAAEVQRRAVVAANLPLTAPESEAFWPVYGKYRDELGKAGTHRSALLARFIGSLDGLSNEAATEMLDEYLELEKKDLAIRTRWAPRFCKVIPAAKVARLYQIENKLDVQAKMELAGKIPLVN